MKPGLPVSVSYAPKYSIVLLNYNQAELTSNCIKSILNSNYDLRQLEIIVIDNASQPEDREKLKKIKSGISGLSVFVFYNSINRNFTGGNNQGIRLSDGQYIIILANDAVVDREWLNEIDKVMDKNWCIGCGGGKILKYGTNKLDTCIPKLSWFGRSHCLGLNEEDTGQYDNEEIDYACGAFMVFQRQTLKETELFDDRFKMHCEDLDLCTTIKENGRLIQFIPKAKIYHIGQATMCHIPKWYVNLHILKNRILWMWKHRRLR